MAVGGAWLALARRSAFVHNVDFGIGARTFAAPSNRCDGVCGPQFRNLGEWGRNVTQRITMRSTPDFKALSPTRLRRRPSPEAPN
jgi:hypothetical protein